MGEYFYYSTILNENLNKSYQQQQLLVERERAQNRKKKKGVWRDSCWERTVLLFNLPIFLSIAYIPCCCQSVSFIGLCGKIC